MIGSQKPMGKEICKLGKEFQKKYSAIYKNLQVKRLEHLKTLTLLNS